MQAHILSFLTPKLLVGVKGSKLFIKSSCIAFQIKGSRIQCTMQKRIMSLHTPSTPNWGVKVKTFFSVMLQIKVKKGDGAQRTTQAHSLSLHTNTVKRSKIILKLDMLHIKLEGNET